MSRVRDFFLLEADECLAALRAELGVDPPDPRRLHAAARLLRGSAQMARFGAVAGRAGELERRLKTLIGDGAGASGPLPPSGAPGASVAWVRDRVGELTVEIRAIREGRVQADPRTESVMDGEQGAGAPLVPMEELEYTGRDALEKALELRRALEDAIGANDSARPILDELFELVRQGMR